MLSAFFLSLAWAFGHYPVNLRDDALSIHEAANLLQEGRHLVDQDLPLARFGKVNGLLKDIVGIGILHELHKIAVK